MSEAQPEVLNLVIVFLAIAALVSLFVYHFYFNVLQLRGHPFTRQGWLHCQREQAQREARREHVDEEARYMIQRHEFDGLIQEMTQELMNTTGDVTNVTFQYPVSVRLGYIERRLQQQQNT